MHYREQLLQLETWLDSQIIGQQKLVNRLLIALLADGHLLVEGAPGLAKTKAIKILAEGIEGDFHRVQFTPDLLPSDITGTEIYRAQDASFEFQKGPIFHNLILADEINRAPAKVQSALLEAMAERQVSFGRQTFKLPELFLVMATQNPIEQEGTYPLPEAQLDRFLLQIDVGYPDRDTERQILLTTTGLEEGAPHAAFAAGDLIAAQRLIRQMPVGEAVVEAILDLVRASRPGAPEAAPFISDALVWGPGPRAAQALMLVTRARAVLNGRYAPTLDDVHAMAAPVLRHRMSLSFSARARGETVDAVIARLLDDRIGGRRAA